jgi:hypothetical protein
LYFHGETSVGSGESCYLLVRGTKKGQRRFTGQKDNCTVHALGTGNRSRKYRSCILLFRFTAAAFEV